MSFLLFSFVLLFSFYSLTHSVQLADRDSGSHLRQRRHTHRHHRARQSAAGDTSHVRLIETGRPGIDMVVAMGYPDKFLPNFMQFKSSESESPPEKDGFSSVGRLVILGRGLQWEGQPSKLKWINNWASSEALNNPGKVMMYIDVDMLWGGCHLDFEVKFTSSEIFLPTEVFTFCPVN